MGVCIQILCFGKNGCINLPAFATGNRNLACLGCNELFFLATIFHQNLQSGCKHSLIQSLLCIPNHGYCLKWMQACFCDVCFTPLAPGLFISCGLPVCCHAHGGRGAAIKPLRPNAQDLCMDCQYTGHTSAYDQSRGMTITVESFVLMIPMVQSKAFPIVFTMESQW